MLIQTVHPAHPPLYRHLKSGGVQSNGSLAFAIIGPGKRLQLYWEENFSVLGTLKEDIPLGDNSSWLYRFLILWGKAQLYEDLGISCSVLF